MSQIYNETGAVGFQNIGTNYLLLPEEAQYLSDRE
jgi:hypothetical protein